MKFYIVILALYCLQGQIKAEDESGVSFDDEDDMEIIEESSREARETEEEEDENDLQTTSGERDAKQFFWGTGSLFPSGGYPFVMQRWGMPIMPMYPRVPSNQCKNSKGYTGTCVTIKSCYSLFHALPADLPSWAIGTKDNCVMNQATPDRMGYTNYHGVCCTEPHTPATQARTPALQPVQTPSHTQNYPGFPAGTMPISRQGFGGGFPGGFGGQFGGPPGFGGQFGGQPGGPGQFGQPGGRPPGGPGQFGQPGGFPGQQRPPPGSFPGPQRPPPGSFPGQPGPQRPPRPQDPTAPAPQRPPRPQKPAPAPAPAPTTAPAPQKPNPAPVQPDNVVEVRDGECGIGRTPIVYNEDGEEIEQLKRFDDESAGKVAGGSDASKNEWPWVVMLMNRGRQFCDGSIIDRYHILTAAHCVAQMKASDVTTLSVRAGAHNLQNSANEAGVQNVNVKLVVKNKKFSMSTLHSDIAILVLKTPIKYTSTVKAVCLPKGKQSYEDKMGTVVGWGLLRENGPRPTVLQELTMKIWNNDKCKRTYGSTAPAGIKDTMLCAGQKGKDSCSGDSGGPFSVPNSNGRWEQVGVVSWGIGCGKEHYPGVYTRVTHMMDWIEKVRRLYPN